MAQQEIHSLVRYTMPGSTFVLYTITMFWVFFARDREIISLIMKAGSATIAALSASILIIGLICGFLLFQIHHEIYWQLNKKWLTQNRPIMRLLADILDADMMYIKAPVYLREELKQEITGFLGSKRWNLLLLVPVYYDVIRADMVDFIRRSWSILHYLWMLSLEIPPISFALAFMIYMYLCLTLGEASRLIISPRDFSTITTLPYVKLSVLLFLVFLSFIAGYSYTRLFSGINIMEYVILYNYMDEYVKIVRRAVAAVIWEWARALPDPDTRLLLRKACLAVLKGPENQQAFRELLARYVEIKQALFPQGFRPSGGLSPA